MRPSVFLAVAFANAALSQHADPQTEEHHPKLTTWKCTKKHGCLPQDTAVVLDSLKRPLYQVDNPDLGCGTSGSPPNVTVCPDAKTCQKNCVMEGIDDYSVVGVKTDGGNLHLDMLDDNLLKLSPRVYLLNKHEREYEILNLLGQEIAFDVDVSKLPCGMNGAFYLSEMEKDGGRSKLNKAGPAYGTGYCDAQCYIPPFINGEGNIKGYGACCNELDIFESNSRSTHLAPHACTITGFYECQGAECNKGGVCDKPGCRYNPYNVGDKEFYGHDMVIDTTRPFTVVTRFPTDEAGNLKSINRFYIQDGTVIENASTNETALPDVNYIDDEYCDALDATTYLAEGGTVSMGAAMQRGMVLCMSVWWDESGGNMSWLDGPGSGPCAASEGSPAWIRQNQPDTKVTFSNIKWGEIGSTHSV